MTSTKESLQRNGSFTTTSRSALECVDPDDIATPVVGSDSEGRTFASIEEMWQSLGVTSDTPRDEINQRWYDKASDWYEGHCPPTVDGVLGGFGSISEIDLTGSNGFLKELRKKQPSLDWTMGAACECGAGIGRVTKGLLLDLGVTHVDIVESSSRLLCAAPDYIGEEAAAKCRFFCSGLQDWTPPARHYSIIWVQWVLCYLTDDDIVAFLKRCGEGLLEDSKGVIILKENTCGEETFVVDNEDASVCRSLEYWLKLVKAAGLRVIHQTMQLDFPDEIYPVPMLALAKACQA
jgi:protein N-terminal methyltransferase